MDSKNKIYDLSWNGTSFHDKMTLFRNSRRKSIQDMLSSDRHVQAEVCSALSSTYYSIAGTGVAQLRLIRRSKRSIFKLFQILLWCLTWLPLVVWCYWRMLPLSNRVVRLIGYDRMSADQCDIRQSILRRRGRYKEALLCIKEALAKNPEKAHTRGLLFVGLADIYLRDGYKMKALTVTNRALTEAEKAEEQDLRQAARIYRYCAGLLGHLERSDLSYHIGVIYEKANSLAQEAGAKDQLLKMM